MKEKKNLIRNKLLRNVENVKKPHTTGCILKRVDQLPELYSELCQTYKREVFAKIINNLCPLKTFAKNSILDV